ncbi:unnamed protein product [Vitrella brassicaformis CCMP3155]|uniref:Uncharacterized protein n=1 Tax=Vitrella brassicaformis (strain CCMP3155) TaxID=1169540 RepID=A0A0G4H2S0_VITBC|nr:unnamed protein product [Vitrella brassicaformis CCMP3155]|eukprot:CEM37794.1 unnamed protein product [Vitrella brassicaformis CCMP3155]
MAHSSSAASSANPSEVPPGCKGLDDVKIVPVEGVSPVSRRLLEGCIRRTFTEAAQVTQLIRQGADPRATGGLCHQRFPEGEWSSRQLQRDVINALIDGGADINEDRPLHVAIRARSLTAVEALLARQVDVRRLVPLVMQLPYIDGAAPPPTRECEDILMSIYRRLIQHDSTLAAERSALAEKHSIGRAGGRGLVHLAARHLPCLFSQSFIDAYLTFITSHGADMKATDTMGCTPLHEAARHGSYRVARWLCRQLTADDVNRGKPNQPDTPLAVAANQCDDAIEQQELQPRHYAGSGLYASETRREIRRLKTTIGVLLRGGAAPSIARMPTATERQRRSRRLMLFEYTTVLAELSEAVMSAINAALAPQRDHSMLLTRLLPLAPHHDGAHPHPSPSNMAFGPHEAEAIAWKIGAFLHEPPAAAAAIDEYLTGESQLRRRVSAAVAHFVKSAATQTSTNREVVGGMASVGGVMVRVPLQCFAIRADSRPHQVVHTRGRVGVREVVHRARLDEPGLVGVVKGFNEHLGDQDCRFSWQQLGRIDKTTGLFVSLDID